ncbi:AAA family ATPase [Bacteroidota bacterium]
MIIIGITGTNGAGKGTVVDYLIQEKGFVHYSVRAYLLEIIKEKGLPENRESMINVANSLREINDSPSFIIDQLYQRAIENGKNCIIESIRTVGEIKSLKEKGNFCLIAVEANPKVRFKRILLRRSETDHITYNTFLENENREMLSDDPNKQNLSACIELADFVLNNNGSVEELKAQTDRVLEELIINN